MTYPDREVVRCSTCGEQHDRLNLGCPFCGSPFYSARSLDTDDDDAHGTTA